MQVCSYTNLVVASALFAALAFGGCANNQSPPAESPDTEAAAAETDMPEEPTALDPADEMPTEGADEAGDEGGDPSAAGEAAGDGEEETRTTKLIQQVILDNREPIRACYEKAQKDLPSLKGTMTIHFVLDPEGKVKKAELNLERSTLKSKKVADCAIAELKKLKFPPSSRGMESKVNYPFDFNP